MSSGQGGKRKPELRACLVCSILQPPADFVKAGCPNCEDVCEMRGSADKVAECTSLVWDGMIAVINPEESWVARWQRIEKKERGMYAVMVTGRAPPDVIEAIEARGGTYRPRDRVED